MLRVVVLSGVSESRQAFKQICGSKLQSLRHAAVCLSYNDLAKDVASKCGWRDTHTPEDDRFIADIQRALIAWDDAVLKDIVTEVDAYHYTGIPIVVFIDVEDTVEVAKVKTAFNASTVIIRRPQSELDLYNTSTDPAQCVNNWDYTIWHDGDRAQLTEEVAKFIPILLSSTTNVYKADESYC